MAIKYDATPASGTSLTANDSVVINSITLKGGSAATSLKIYHNTGVAILECNAAIGTSFFANYNAHGGHGGGLQLKGPVTYDLVGAGSAVTFIY